MNNSTKLMWNRRISFSLPLSIHIKFSNLIFQLNIDFISLRIRQFRELDSGAGVFGAGVDCSNCFFSSFHSSRSLIASHCDWVENLFACSRLTGESLKNWTHTTSIKIWIYSVKQAITVSIHIRFLIWAVFIMLEWISENPHATQSEKFSLAQSVDEV